MAINSLSAASYGLSGLASGINTQEMVEKMLSGTQARINKATQQKTTLQNKQSLYREVMDKLKNLQNSYLSFTSKTNLLSNAFYNTMSTTVTPPSGQSAPFSVTASSNAQVGNITMDYIKQLATARTEKTTVDASGKVEATLDRTAAQRLLNKSTGLDSSLSIRVGDQTVSFGNVPMTFSQMSQSEVATLINDKFKAEGINATAVYRNNKLEITADREGDYVTITGANGSATSMAMFGTSSVSLTGKGGLKLNLDTDNFKPSFEVNLDGRQQTIRMDLHALQAYAEGGDGESLALDIEKQLKRYFGDGVKLDHDVDADGNVTFNFSSGATSQKFTITGSTGEMTALGLKSGISNKLNTSMALKDLNFSTPLQGNQHTFSINGVEFSYDGSTQLRTILNDINNSKAGVKVSYLESEDRFVIQSAETGSGTPAFEIKQTEGNLMTAMFGVDGGMTTTGSGVNMDMVGGYVNGSEISNGGTFTFNINGKDYSYTISRGKDDDPYTRESFAAALNKRLANAFGTMPDGKQSIEFKFDSASEAFVVRANHPDYTVKGTESTRKLGFTPASSTRAFDENTKLADAGITFGDDASITIRLNNGKTGEFGDVTDDVITITGEEINQYMADGITMKGLADLINERIAAEATGDAASLPKVEFDAKSAAFRVMGVDIPMEIVIAGDDDSANLGNVFGAQRVTIGEKPAVATTDPDGKYRVETDAGKNAIFSLNGSEIERSTNSFTIDDLTFTLHEDTVLTRDADDNPVDYRGATKVTVSRDTDSIVEGIEEFLKLYNETVDFINSLYRADPTYKDYAPLSDAQKADMSDREIELWEEKSKEGLLRNDSSLERILQGLRTAMYTKPEGSSIAIYDLGINTSFYTPDGNFGLANREDLKSMLEANPDAVRQLFAGEGGIMELVNDAINDATRSSYANPGYITQQAGANALDTTSNIYKQVKQIDEQLVSLEKKYWSEYDRYWKQFNAMEQMIMQMNSQSSWLTQMGG